MRTGAPLVERARLVAGPVVGAAGEPSIRDALHELGLSDLGIGLLVGVFVTLVVVWVIAPAIAGRFAELPPTEGERLAAKIRDEIEARLEEIGAGDDSTR